VSSRRLDATSSTAAVSAAGLVPVGLQGLKELLGFMDGVDGMASWTLVDRATPDCGGGGGRGAGGGHGGWLLGAVLAWRAFLPDGRRPRPTSISR